LDDKRGEVFPKVRGHRRRIISPAEELILDELLLSKPDMTLDELRIALNKDCSLPTIMRALTRMGYRVKKNSKGIRTK
jgi:transposase